MKGERFSVEQTLGVLKQAETGVQLVEVMCKAASTAYSHPTGAGPMDSNRDEDTYPRIFPGMPRWRRKFLCCLGFVLLVCPCSANSRVVSTAATESRIVEITFHSAALNKSAVFSVILPEQRPPAGGYQVLIILHGHGRNHHTLLENEETLKLLTAQPYLIVLPDSGTGWWIDSQASGANYDGMLLDVIAEVKRRYPVNQSLSSWGVLGWSMGGFGAMHFSERHPECVSFVGSIIGLLDFPRVEGLPDGQRYPVDQSVFGAETEGWRRENPSQHVMKLAGKDLVVVIGKQAFDRTMNENFLNRARSAGLQLAVYRIEGSHDFPTVVNGLRILLPLAATHFRQSAQQAYSRLTTHSDYSKATDILSTPRRDTARRCQ